MALGLRQFDQPQCPPGVCSAATGESPLRPHESPHMAGCWPMSPRLCGRARRCDACGRRIRLGNRVTRTINSGSGIADKHRQPRQYVVVCLVQPAGFGHRSWPADVLLLELRHAASYGEHRTSRCQPASPALRWPAARGRARAGSPGQRIRQAL